MSAIKTALFDVVGKVEEKTGHDFDYIFDSMLLNAQPIGGEWYLVYLEDTLSDSPRVDDCYLVFRISGEFMVDGSETICREFAELNGFT